IAGTGRERPLRHFPADLITRGEAVTTAEPDAILLPESAHQAAVVTLAMPVDTELQFVARADLPAAGNPQAVAVVVAALTGVGEQCVAAVLYGALQGQRGITLLAILGGDHVVAFAVTLFTLPIGVPVITQVVRDLQPRHVEFQPAEILLIPGHLCAMPRTFLKPDGLP